MKYSCNVCALCAIQSYVTNDKAFEEEMFHRLATGYNQNIEKLFIV